MGTRNLSLCKKHGEIKISQYGQWDGYPEGQGATILKFCQNKENLEKLKNCVDEIKDVKDLKEFCEQYNKLTPEWSDEPDNRTEEMKFWFDSLCCRDIGGKIFNNILTLDKTRLPKEMDEKIYLAMADLTDLTNYCDLFIEYAYLINFDTNKLECYADCGENYKGVLLAEFDLYDLPSEMVFIDILTREEGKYYTKGDEEK